MSYDYLAARCRRKYVAPEVRSERMRRQWRNSPARLQARLEAAARAARPAPPRPQPSEEDLRKAAPMADRMRRTEAEETRNQRWRRIQRGQTFAEAEKFSYNRTLMMFARAFMDARLKAEKQARKAQEERDLYSVRFPAPNEPSN